MNILTARKQLHQISSFNPQSQHVNYFEEANQETLMKNKFKASKTPNKQQYTQQAYDRFLREESSRIFAEKHNYQQRIQIKTPHFMNNQGDNFSSSQRIRFQKLGLQNFLDRQSMQNNISHTQEPEQKRIIKNLNNTYFRTTQHIHAKRKNMVNTLGIKKSSNSHYNVDWDSKQFDETEITWKQIGYIPNKVFPCRKINNVKSRIFTPRKNDSIRKEENIFVQSKICKVSSLNLLQSKSNILKSPQDASIKQPEKVKSNLNPSKALNKSIQSISRKAVEKTTKASEPTRPRSEIQKRPESGRDIFRRNQSANQKFIKPRQHRGYSGFGNKSFHSFTESVSKQIGVENGLQILKVYDVYKNSGLVGKRMSIYH